MTRLAYSNPNSGFLLTGAVASLAVIASLVLDTRLGIAMSMAPLFILLFYRYPLLLLYLFPLINLIDMFVTYHVRAAGFLLKPMDPVYYCTVIHLGIYALRNPKRFTGILKENPFLSLFLLVVVLYVVLFTPIYGKSALGEARKVYFAFLFPLLALVAIKRPEDLRRFFYVLLVSATVVAFAGILFAGIQGSLVRAIHSEASLVGALAAFSMIVHRMYRMVLVHPVVDRLLLFLFALIAFVPAHRSVWLAVGAGLLMFLWLYRNRLAFMIKALTLAVIITSGASVVFVMTPPGARFLEKVTGFLNPTEDRTASWRIERWEKQLERIRDGNLIFGEGVGAYYTQDSGGRSPHNAYIQLLLKFGLLGLSIYILLALNFFSKGLALWRRLPRGPTKAYLEMGIVSFAAAHGFGLGYGFPLTIFFFVGTAMAAMKLSRERVPRAIRDLKSVPVHPVAAPARVGSYPRQYRRYS